MKTSTAIDKLLSISIAVVCLMAVAMFVRPWISDLPKPAITQRLIHKHINLPEVDFRKSGRTVVLVLSTNCRHCAANAPFYRHLVTKEREGGFRTVALFLEPPAVAEKYMFERGIKVDMVVRGDLNKLGVLIPGTPTVLLVSQDGVVQDAWVGELPPKYQREVMRHIS